MGSEMCIRDRFLACQRCASAAREVSHFLGLTVGFIEKNALRKLGARNTVYSRHQCTKAGKQPRATQEATGCVDRMSSSWARWQTRVRRRACSATRARRATASAVAWPTAARVCQKYWPRRNLKASAPPLLAVHSLGHTEALEMAPLVRGDRGRSKNILSSNILRLTQGDIGAEWRPHVQRGSGSVQPWQK